MNDQERLKSLMDLLGMPMDMLGMSDASSHKPEEPASDLTRVAVALEGKHREIGALMWAEMSNVINDTSKAMLYAGMRKANDPIAAAIAADTCRALAHFYDGVAESVALTEGGTKPMFKESDPAFQEIAKKTKEAIEGQRYRVLKFKIVNIKVPK